MARRTKQAKTSARKTSTDRSVKVLHLGSFSGITDPSVMGGLVSAPTSGGEGHPFVRRSFAGDNTPADLLTWVRAEDNLPPFSAVEWLGRDPILRIKLVGPFPGMVRYIAAGSADTEKVSKFENDFICFGYATQDADQFGYEWGDFSLREIEALPMFMFLGAERDLSFKPRRFSALFPNGGRS